jgi:hypothetical protein
MTTKAALQLAVARLTAALDPTLDAGGRNGSVDGARIWRSLLQRVYQPSFAARSLGVLAVATLATLLLTGSLHVRSPAAGVPVAGHFELRGISYPSFHNGAYASGASSTSLAALAKTGANFVAIVPTRFSKTISDSAFFDTAATESDASVLTAIRQAHALGLSVLLKPHVDPMDGTPRSHYAPHDPAEWFRNYEAFLLHYAAIAAEQQVAMLSIGCELDSLAGPRYRAEWLHLVAAVRAVYSGRLVYSAETWGQDDVSFWDQVDLIGVDAYDPLSYAHNPTLADLVAGWTTVSSNPWVAAKSNHKSPLENYRALSIRFGKPVVFSEIGYKSVAGAMTRPGDWRFKGRVDLALQARAYEAFFQVWGQETDWMKGAFLWNWEPVPDPERTPGGLAGYTPQNKPAAEVITRWYQAMSRASSPPAASR